MNILVYDIAAEHAGAMTILKNFYDEVIGHEDKSHNWYFVVSNNELIEQDNVKVICVPWIKKTWIHRWFYDTFCAGKLVKQYEIDLVFSMQNMPMKGAKCKQFVYLHQSLQFSPIQYSLFKKEERVLWVRQNIICNLMRKSLKYADIIIVQTNWMKKATKDWLKEQKKRIEVLVPDVKIEGYCEENIERVCDLFFYPAAGEIYKNHRIIIRACEILKQRNVAYRVLFTMNKNESCYANDLYSEIKQKNLNIEFVGLLKHEEIMRLYKRATLVFPSCLESFGLPLLEAKKSDGIIICSDLPFSHEILDDYDNAYFFDVKNAEQLADYIEKCSGSIVKQSKNTSLQETSDLANRINLVEFILGIK